MRKEQGDKETRRRGEWERIFDFGFLISDLRKEPGDKETRGMGEGEWEKGRVGENFDFGFRISDLRKEQGDKETRRVGEFLISNQPAGRQVSNFQIPKGLDSVTSATNAFPLSPIPLVSVSVAKETKFPGYRPLVSSLRLSVT